MAARLSEDERRSVLLLESGPDYPTQDLTPDAIRYAYGAGTTIWDGDTSGTSAPGPRPKRR